MKFEMDAIESEPGTPETTRVIFTGRPIHVVVLTTKKLF